ncbi:MAG: NAD(P)H dehydrogenase (quinone) [Crocinitomix sp.]|jgi:NAD(P)H dehydrogenase (quinone)
MKKIVVINGHPDQESFCTALAEQYKSGAESSGADCKLIHLADLKFNPILTHGYRKRTELESDLLIAWDLIKESEHLVFVYPNWWGTAPALLKGFIDRVFLPNFAFKYGKSTFFWDKLLAGKSARLIVTMDTPLWYYRFIFKSPGHNAMKKGTLHFCGIKPVKITSFSPIKSSTKTKREQWLHKVEHLGRIMK